MLYMQTVNIVQSKAESELISKIPLQQMSQVFE